MHLGGLWADSPKTPSSLRGGLGVLLEPPGREGHELLRGRGVDGHALVEVLLRHPHLERDAWPDRSAHSGEFAMFGKVGNIEKLRNYEIV